MIGKLVEMRCRDPTGVLGKEGSVIPAALGCSELTKPNEHNQRVPTYRWTKTCVFQCRSHGLQLLFSSCKHPQLGVSQHIPFSLAVMTKRW